MPPLSEDVMGDDHIPLDILPSPEIMLRDALGDVASGHADYCGHQALLCLAQWLDKYGFNLNSPTCQSLIEGSVSHELGRFHEWKQPEERREHLLSFIKKMRELWDGLPIQSSAS